MDIRNQLTTIVIMENHDFEAINDAWVDGIRKRRSVLFLKDGKFWGYTDNCFNDQN